MSLPETFDWLCWVMAIAAPSTLSSTTSSSSSAGKVPIGLYHCYIINIIDTIYMDVPASLMTDWVSPMSPLLSNRERSTAPCSLVIMARWARMNRDEVNDPRVNPPT